jgi:hypothetical protein
MQANKQANNCLRYATAQAIKDSKTLQMYRAKTGPGTELNVSASCHYTVKGRMITNE